MQIIEEIAQKGDVRNPSAFLSKALAAHPQPRPEERGRRDGARGYHSGRRGDYAEDAASHRERGRRAEEIRRPNMRVRHSGHPVEDALDRYPEISDTLDHRAVQLLHEVDPARAVEIIEDVADKGDVRNPSAFIAKALQKFPHKRERPDAFGDPHSSRLFEPPMKRMKTVRTRRARSSSR